MTARAWHDAGRWCCAVLAPAVAALVACGALPPPWALVVGWAVWAGWSE